MEETESAKISGMIQHFSSTYKVKEYLNLIINTYFIKFAVGRGILPSYHCEL